MDSMVSAKLKFLNPVHTSAMNRKSMAAATKR